MLAREIFGKFIETQGSMIRSLVSRVPNLLLNVVMGWACALFFGYGILAGANLLTLLMAALGSVAIASAIFLLLEMSDPYTGLFRVSCADGQSRGGDSGHLGDRRLHTGPRRLEVGRGIAHDFRKSSC